jgi:hypothetical protein
MTHFFTISSGNHHILLLRSVIYDPDTTWFTSSKTDPQSIHSILAHKRPMKKPEFKSVFLCSMCSCGILFTICNNVNRLGASYLNTGNDWFITQQFSWTLPIVWDILHTPHVLRVGSNHVFIWVVVILLVCFLLFLFVTIV